mmetsp:Transcript_24202/g.78243  ORF Transcript_24202/g.78243 Transcript_24202/m.78243 type:complete len:231 (-) Transcript_24202:96-788(-)
MLPSDVGPARDCRHGGPKPDMRFIQAMIQSLNTSIAASNDAIRRVQAPDSDYTRDDIAAAEFGALVNFWSKREHGRTIASDSWKIAFACAVDAVIDEEFVTARIFIRTGVFVREFAEKGKRVATERMSAEVERCLWKTRTDRGCGLYLAAAIPCRCLDAVVALTKPMPSTGKCATCEVQVAKAGKLLACGRCREVEYCSLACQKKDWPQHKRVCRKVDKAREKKPGPLKL